MNQWKHGRLLTVIAIALITVLAGSLNAVPPARAQSEGGVTMATEAGFDGYCKENAWLPVRVTLANDGPDLKGNIQIVYQSRYGITDTIRSEELLIPTTSRKELTFYAYPPQGSYSMNVSLLVNGKALATNKLTRSCLGRQQMLFGVLSDKPGSYDILKEIDLTRGDASTAKVHVKELPEQAQGWESLDGLVVSGTDTGALTDAQREAMKLWVGNGGKLLLVGGPQWQAAAAGLQDVLPVDIQSTQTVTDLSGLQAYFQVPDAPVGPAIVAAVKPRAGATSVVESAGLPLIVRKPVGFGEVMYLAADPSLEPLSQWDGMKAVYSYLLAAKALRPEWTKTPWEQSSSNQALSTLRELGLPSSLFLCGWMGLYILVIGPLNFMILRRRKRGELAWFTVPALVVLFSVVAYAYGNFYRGNRPILNRIALIQAWDGSEQAKIHGLVGVYSPSRAKYTLQASDPFVLYPFDSENTSLGIQGGSTTAMPDLRVEIGGMKPIAVDGSRKALPLTHDLVLSIDEHTANLRGKIRNASPYTLKGAMLVTPGDWKNLGDLSPGGYANVNIALNPGNNGPQFYAQDANTILNWYPYNTNGVSDQDMSRKAAMLQALLNERYQGNWGIFLMGWLDKEVMPVSVQGRSSDAMDTTLYVDQLNPAIAYTSPATGITPGLMAWEASTDGPGPFSQNYYGTSGGYILRFHPAIPVPYKSVQSLILTLEANTGASPSQVSASLWDYKERKWVPLDNPSWGPNNIPDAARYVGPGGEVRLWIQTGTNSYIGISTSTVSLVVDR